MFIVGLADCNGTARGKCCIRGCRRSCSAHAGDLSRNRTVGLRLGKGESLEDITAGMKAVAEGILTSRAAHDLAAKLQVQAPIIDGIYRVIHEKADPVAVVTEVMSRRQALPERAAYVLPAIQFVLSPVCVRVWITGMHTNACAGDIAFFGLAAYRLQVMAANVHAVFEPKWMMRSWQQQQAEARKSGTLCVESSVSRQDMKRMANVAQWLNQARECCHKLEASRCWKRPKPLP